VLLFEKSVEMFVHLEKKYAAKRANAVEKNNAAKAAHFGKPASPELSYYNPTYV
jgi:hypothetical protein